MRIREIDSRDEGDKDVVDRDGDEHGDGREDKEESEDDEDRVVDEHSSRITNCEPSFIAIRTAQCTNDFNSSSSKQSWRDDRLRWNPSNFSGLEFLAVRAAVVWYPPLLVLNA